jgi:hypothetical protein
MKCKVYDSNIVWCERYKKENLFVRGKTITITYLDAPLNNLDRGDS